MAGKKGAAERFYAPYGSIMLGSNNRIFIVPHGFNHEESGAHEAVALVAMETSSFAILNSAIPRSQINLNDYQSIEESKSKQAKQFLEDLIFLVGQVRDQQEKVTVFFVHCCPEVYSAKRTLFKRDLSGKLVTAERGAKRPYVVDMGAGIVEVESSLLDDEPQEEFLARKYPLAKDFRRRLFENAGELTCSREQVYRLQNSLLSQGIQATVGLEWPASRKTNLTQVVREIFPTVEVIQLEFACQPELMKTTLQAVIKTSTE